jgi:cytochrome P450
LTTRVCGIRTSSSEAAAGLEDAVSISKQTSGQEVDMTNPAVQANGRISPGDYNPMLPHVRADPYPYFAALRRESPVHQIVPGVPLYAVARYDDVCFVLHHPELFSSTALQVLAGGGGVSLSPNSGALAGHRLLDASMMIAVDPPDHARLRRLVNRGFTPRRIAALEPRLREIAVGCIEGSVRSGRMELMHELAIPFPVTVIAELLGIEPDRTEQFKHWSDAVVIGLSGASRNFTREDVVEAADEMAEYIDRIVEERRRRPCEDLISVLVAAEGGDALSADEVRAFVVLLLIAGNETTTNLIGNAMNALLAHPDSLERVAYDRSLLPAMIEEALRYDSPIQGIPRKLVQDTELAGVPLAKDAFLMVMFASANRDERRFAEPDRFDIDRRTRDHIAFGNGIHFCLGAALARLEARVAFETIFERCRGFRLEADKVPMVESMLLRGPQSLPLSFSSV